MMLGTNTSPPQLALRIICVKVATFLTQCYPNIFFLSAMSDWWIVLALPLKYFSLWSLPISNIYTLVKITVFTLLDEPVNWSLSAFCSPFCLFLDPLIKSTVASYEEDIGECDWLTYKTCLWLLYQMRLGGRRKVWKMFAYLNGLVQWLIPVILAIQEVGIQEDYCLRPV
jgi:hypothetical protein